MKHPTQVRCRYCGNAVGHWTDEYGQVIYEVPYWDYNDDCTNHLAYQVQKGKLIPVETHAEVEFYCDPCGNEITTDDANEAYYPSDHLLELLHMLGWDPEELQGMTEVKTS